MQHKQQQYTITEQRRHFSSLDLISSPPSHWSHPCISIPLTYIHTYQTIKYNTFHYYYMYRYYYIHTYYYYYYVIIIITYILFYIYIFYCLGCFGWLTNIHSPISPRGIILALSRTINAQTASQVLLMLFFFIYIFLRHIILLLLIIRY
jgi:hypothetical protein